MFNKLFKQESGEAKRLYACALDNTRKEIFYTRYKVPDSFDGRFDLLLLHIFIILQRIMEQDNYQELSQCIFDEMFKDMDQTLREMGIGDVGIPKHMKKMMKAFNGRMHNYQMAINPDVLTESKFEGLSKVTLEESISRNLYAMELSDDNLDKNALDEICKFVLNNISYKKDIFEFLMLESK